MGIPAFNSNSVLPPYLGNPCDVGSLSPYPCDTHELCQRFATSGTRVAILEGLLELRRGLATAGVVAGFQWVGGSFLEDVENRSGRPPNDIDVVTMFQGIDVARQAQIASAHPMLVGGPAAKAAWRVDHYFVDVGYSPDLTIESVRYWIGLFSHRRDDVWKGLLQIQLDTPPADQMAAAHLQAWRAGHP